MYKDNHHRVSLLFLASTLLMIACTGQACSTLKPNDRSIEAPVPGDYQALYNELDGQLDEFVHLLTVQQGVGAKPLTFAAELLPANANRGEVLLKEQTLDGVSLYLDRLHSLGVEGVKVNIAYPLLLPDFPRSKEYLEFYKQVAVLVRQRNMRLLVGVGVTFTDPTFGNLEVDFSGLTIDAFTQSQRQQIETILGKIQPDYLTIINEPDTLSGNIGLEINLGYYTYFLDGILKDLNGGETLIGAGAGNWNDIAYIEHAAQHPDIDYIDLHIYPITRDHLVKIIQCAETAQRNEKRLVIGEAWLYKSSQTELGGVSAAEIISRDVFSFWDPLDARFLKLLVQFAQQNRVEFVSAFWSKYFFAYVDYEKTPRRLSPRQLLEKADQAAVESIIANRLTQTGTTYQQLAR